MEFHCPRAGLRLQGSGPVVLGIYGWQSNNLRILFMPPSLHPPLNNPTFAFALGSWLLHQENSSIT